MRLSHTLELSRPPICSAGMECPLPVTPRISPRSMVPSSSFGTFFFRRAGILCVCSIKPVPDFLPTRYEKTRGERPAFRSITAWAPSSFGIMACRVSLGSISSRLISLYFGLEAGRSGLLGLSWVLLWRNHLPVRSLRRANSSGAGPS